MRDSSKIGLQALIAVAAISGNPPKQDAALAQERGKCDSLSA